MKSIDTGISILFSVFANCLEVWYNILLMCHEYNQIKSSFPHREDCSFFMQK